MKGPKVQTRETIRRAELANKQANLYSGKTRDTASNSQRTDGKSTFLVIAERIAGHELPSRR